jgi:hypothetical protein
MHLCRCNQQGTVPVSVQNPAQPKIHHKHRYIQPNPRASSYSALHPLVFTPWYSSAIVDAVSYSPHNIINKLRRGFPVRRDLVLVLHMPPPIILSRERLSALARVRTLSHHAVVLPLLVVLVVDMPFEVRLRPEPFIAPLVVAFVGSLVVAAVVAGESGLASCPEG